MFWFSWCCIEMTTILKEMRIAQLCSKSERTLGNETDLTYMNWNAMKSYLNLIYLLFLSLNSNIFSITIYNPIKQCAVNLFTAIATQRVSLTVEVLPTIGKTQDREDANESYFWSPQHAGTELDTDFLGKKFSRFPK